MNAAVARLLEQVCVVNDRAESRFISRFHACTVPEIPVGEYFTRVIRNAECSEACALLAFIYIDRAQRHPDITVCSRNAHRLVITAVTVAAKYFDDVFFNNAFYSKVGGLACSELNALEIEFLFLITFSLFVSPAEFAEYRELVAQHAQPPLARAPSAAEAEEEEEEEEAGAAAGEAAAAAPGPGRRRDAEPQGSGARSRSRSQRRVLAAPAPTRAHAAAAAAPSPSPPAAGPVRSFDIARAAT